MENTLTDTVSVLGLVLLLFVVCFFNLNYIRQRTILSFGKVLGLI